MLLQSGVINNISILPLSRFGHFLDMVNNNVFISMPRQRCLLPMFPVRRRGLKGAQGRAGEFDMTLQGELKDSSGQLSL